MKAYIALLRDIEENGNDRGDRTGTGTRSVFGRSIRFDLQEGFPLVTTKKIHFKSVVAELLWMLAGGSNTEFLHKHGVTIWDEWSTEEGDLGPVYGSNWRKWGAVPDSHRQPVPICAVTPTYLGVANGESNGDISLKKTWEGMIARCYDKNSPSYSRYGARGVFVVDRWLQYTSFLADAKELPGWEEKSEAKERYVLDKDELGDGFEYGPTTCQWVTDKRNGDLSRSRVFRVKKDGIVYTFTNIEEFCAANGCLAKNFSDLWTGNKNAKVRNGFTLVDVRDQNAGIDQLSLLVTALRTNPYSRRHVVSAWNVADLPDESLSPQENATKGKMALAPCHFAFQCYVEQTWNATPDPASKEYFKPGFRLSLQMHMRSTDAFLGLPFNIASYALLTHLLAQQLDMEVGELIITFGDLHIYQNHRTNEVLYEQLSREPKALPWLRIKRCPFSLFDYRVDDIKVVDYFPHPAIKAEISV